MAVLAVALCGTVWCRQYRTFYRYTQPSTDVLARAERNFSIWHDGMLYDCFVCSDTYGETAFDKVAEGIIARYSRRCARVPNGARGHWKLCHFRTLTWSPREGEKKTFDIPQPADAIALPDGVQFEWPNARVKYECDAAGPEGLPGTARLNGSRAEVTFLDPDVCRLNATHFTEQFAIECFSRLAGT